MGWVTEEELEPYRCWKLNDLIAELRQRSDLFKDRQYSPPKYIRQCAALAIKAWGVMHQERKKDDILTLAHALAQKCEADFANDAQSLLIPPDGRDLAREALDEDYPVLMYKIELGHDYDTIDPLSPDGVASLFMRYLHDVDNRPPRGKAFMFGRTTQERVYLFKLDHQMSLQEPLP